MLDPGTFFAARPLKSPVIQEVAIIEGIMRVRDNFGVGFSVMRCWQISSRLDHRDTSQHNTNTPETFVVVRSCGTNVFWTKRPLEAVLSFLRPR